MKRGLVVSFVLMLSFSIIAFAVSTTVDVNWDAWGGPSSGITIDFANGDDSNSSLSANGGHYWGEFHGTDSDNNPYGYGVDNGAFSTKAYVADGGVITFDVTRTDSKTSMYGPSGQYTYSGVGTADGEASVVTQTSTNFAGARTCNYGWQSNNQYMASGSSFYINHYINDGDEEGARVSVWNGNGSATVTSMSDEMGGSSFRLGWGCGCYNNANAFGTGSGTFELYGNASNALSGNGWSSGGGTYLQQINYLDGFNVSDSHIDGN